MKLTIGKKLIGGFLIIATILALTSTFSFISIKQVDNSYSDLVDRRAVVLLEAKEIQINASLINGRLRDYLLTFDKNRLDEIVTISDKINNLIESLDNKIINADHKEKIAQIKKLNDLIYQEVNPYIITNKSFSLEFANTKLIPPSRDLRDLAETVALDQQVLMEEGSIATSNLSDTVVFTLIIVSVIAIILSVVIGYFISRMITKPIIIIEQAAEQIANGNLTLDDIKVKNRDEIGLLANEFNQMVHNLRNLIFQVRTSAELVAASSEELNASAEQTSAATEQIATSIQQVASGTDQQVQSVEETSQGISEMSKGVQHIADRAQSVYNTAISASDKAHHGNKTVQNAVEQMNSIHTSVDGLSLVISGLGDQSKQIGQIVQVISDIAAQTNLLALNAAIEAARAGEQGRGFAIVADEVRKLAEQSSGSAEQISHLIGTIQDETNKAIQSMEAATKEVGEGITLVHSAGDVFNDIQNSIDDVSKQIGDVSASVQQISATAVQMVQSIDLISEIAEESAASTQTISSATEEQLASMEESSASANSLSQMAAELQLLISKFKV